MKRREGKTYFCCDAGEVDSKSNIIFLFAKKNKNMLEK